MLSPFLRGLTSKPGPSHHQCANMQKAAFLFPGQGAQYVGMAKSLVDSLAAARQLFAQAADILGYDLLDYCWNGPAERLNATDVSQPAIFVSSLAALEALKQTEPHLIDSVIATAGLSLGEYTALVFAGVMDFADALRVVDCRGKAMQAAASATPSGMVSVLILQRPQVEQIVQQARAHGVVEIANLLCPGNTVVSGELAACDAVEKLVADQGGRTVRLSVAGAFHTHLMRPADTHLAEALAQVVLRPARLPIWSNVDAQPHTDPDEIRALLVQQVLSPVRWEETMRGMLAQGVEAFHEIGPGRVLAGLLKRIHRKIDCRNWAA